MKVVTSTKTVIRVALVDSDPLRLVGFRALLEEESDLELVSASLPEVAAQKDIDVVLIGDRPGHKLFDTMANLRAVRSSMPIIVVGHSASHEVMLNAIVSGARGYVFDGAPAGEFALAIRVVHEGSVWAPRRVLSMFIELAETQRERPLRGSSESITEREKQVLTMLVSGLSNKEIGAPLGITERTVKAHIAKMMRKVGVHNRIELSIQAVARSLVSLPAN
ncbi:MAG: response regulator transcription factor [Terriglobales bacterium]